MKFVKVSHSVSRHRVNFGIILISLDCLAFTGVCTILCTSLVM